MLPGKTIIFAISKAHARRIQELFDLLYPEHQGRLARVLVSDDRFVHGPDGLLQQFKTEDFPRVAISVDMLDTGVDIREAVNLVFAKPVYSYVKFWQMIGRGTRVLEEDPQKRRAWRPEKDRPGSCCQPKREGGLTQLQNVRTKDKCGNNVLTLPHYVAILHNNGGISQCIRLQTTS